MWFDLIHRRLPHVSVKESPKEAKPSHFLDLSDTDTETEHDATVAVRTLFAKSLHALLACYATVDITTQIVLIVGS